LNVVGIAVGVEGVRTSCVPYWLRYVVVSWSTVANATQSRYGTFTYTTQRKPGAARQTPTRAQMSVPRTRRISTVAKRLFCRPNWRGVKAKLKMRLRAKGRAIIHGICRVNAL